MQDLPTPSTQRRDTQVYQLVEKLIHTMTNNDVSSDRKRFILTTLVNLIDTGHIQLLQSGIELAEKCKE